jgi:glycosyltransferase involved in cell wall biosynthesis
MLMASVLIPTKNGETWIEACLRGVYSQQGIAGVDVLIVDSGSTDRTLQIAGRYPVRIAEIPPNEFHHARTRNFAATLSQAEYLIFLSQDAIPEDSNWLASLLKNFSDSEVGAVYGRQLPRHETTSERYSALSAIYGPTRIVKETANKRQLGFRYYHFSSANAAVRRDVWAATRFPEDLKVFEDLGIAKRILDAGWKIVYEPDARVLHSHDHSTVGLFKRYFDIGYTFRRLGIWNARTRDSMTKEWSSMIKQKFGRPKIHDARGKRGGIRMDMAKSAGFWLGVHERYLPLSVKRFLSAHKVFN